MTNRFFQPASSFDAGILTDFKEKLRRPDGKESLFGRFNIFKTRPSVRYNLLYSRKGESIYEEKNSVNNAAMYYIVLFFMHFGFHTGIEICYEKCNIARGEQYIFKKR